MLAKLRCHIPFTSAFNQIVLELLPDDEKSSKKLSGILECNDHKSAIIFLEQVLHLLERTISAENIIRQPYLTTFEAAYRLIAIREIQSLCQEYIGDDK